MLKSVPEKDPNKRTYYIDLGKVAPDKAEEIMRKIKKSLKKKAKKNET
jgi:hypothetical protein